MLGSNSGDEPAIRIFLDKNVSAYAEAVATLDYAMTKDFLRHIIFKLLRTCATLPRKQPFAMTKPQPGLSCLQKRADRPPLGMSVRERLMPHGYWITRITVTNPEHYGAYAQALPAVIKRFGGQFLIAGGRLEAVDAKRRSAMW